VRLIKKYTNELGFIKLAALLFVAGFFIGILIAVLMKESYSGQLAELNETFFTNLNSTTIDNNELFQLVSIKNIKSLLLLFVVCTTVLGIPYLTFYLLLKGFNLGFLLAASIMQYQWKGIILFFLYLFPQYFVYIPVMALAIVKGYYLNRQLHHVSQNKKTTKKIIIEQIPFLFIAAVLLLVGSALEAYANASMIQKLIPSLF
jgi:stage II sporulation protein M